MLVELSDILAHIHNHRSVFSTPSASECMSAHIHTHTHTRRQYRKVAHARNPPSSNTRACPPWPLDQHQTVQSFVSPFAPPSRLGQHTLRYRPRPVDVEIQGHACLVCVCILILAHVIYTHTYTHARILIQRDETSQILCFGVCVCRVELIQSSPVQA